MKNRLLTLFALSSALLFMPPAMAQQGPAGVPGAPLIGAEIAPPPSPDHPAPPGAAPNKRPAHQAAPKPAPAKRQAIPQCRGAKNVKRCEERYARRAEAREACKAEPPHKRKACINARTTRPGM